MPDPNKIVKTDTPKWAQELLDAFPKKEFKPNRQFSACGCRFENDYSNSVLLCEKCSKLPCHNRGA